MASEDLKHIVAREIASGETIAELARRCGYTGKGMKKLVRTAAMQQPIQGERQRRGPDLDGPDAPRDR
jgi:tRNA(Phe) wybutosine-synthesizing methylase Tyw3